MNSETHSAVVDPGQFAHVETWVFDLDNTIYAARHSVFDQIDVRMGSFIAGFLELEPEAARKVQKDYFRTHGTTLRGLMVNHQIDPEDFLEYVHDIDVSRIPPNPDLDAALHKLAGRKVIFTNGSTKHALNVLGQLGVADHFDGIFDIAAADFVPKPEPGPYDQLVKRFAIEPRAAVMVEDMARNLEPAATLGMTTVWVRTKNDWGRENSDADYVHHVIDDVADWLGEMVGK